MKKAFQKTSTGTVYHPEKRKCFRFYADRIEVISLWPKPAGWIKTSDQPNWRCFRPVIKIPCGPLENKIQKLQKPLNIEGDQYLLPLETPAERVIRLNKLHELQFYAQIPEKVRLAITCFKNRQFHLLSMVARCGPPALDLAISNPAIAYMLASNWVFHKPSVGQPLRSARALLKPHKKQKQILGWLDFPPTNAVRKILSRIIPGAITVSNLLYLRQALIAYPEIIKKLCHLPRINAAALRIATDPDLTKHVSMKFLSEISRFRKDDHIPDSAYMLQELLDISRGLDNTQKTATVIDNRKMLIKKHGQVLHVYEKIMEAGLKSGNEKINLPAPPVEGTDTIIPLTTAGEIQYESIVQKNCADSYVKKISSNRFYIYRVLSPERCTLSLKKYHGTWKIDQLEKAGNRPVSEYMKKIIALWLATHQL